MLDMDNVEVQDLMSSRKIDGLEHAQTQVERIVIYECEKKKSFDVFIQLHGCPFGSVDGSNIKRETDKHIQHAEGAFISTY